MTYKSYRILYTHSKAYVMQKSLEAEKGKVEQEGEVAELGKRKERLDHKK